MAPATQHDIHITEATPEDIPSLTTILPRAFHPINAFHRRCNPDTPLIRQWWHEIFTDELSDPRCRLITAIDPSASKELHVVGFLTMILLEADDTGAGFWTSHPPTDDHDKEMWNPAIEKMIKYREKTFAGTGQSHFHIELLGVDHEYKGRGLGMKLLRRACEIADEEGVPMFVQANGSAYKFYQKFGFEVKGRDALYAGEGEADYEEYALLRPLHASVKT